MRIIRKIEMWELGKLLMCSNFLEFFADFFYYTELVENCIKTTVFGRKNKNLCHTIVLAVVETTLQ